jgi:hypothetical protein
MRIRLRETLARLLARFWGRWPRRPLVVVKEDDESNLGRTGARARFWAEFREGQREAEAHSSRPR